MPYQVAESMTDIKYRKYKNYTNDKESIKFLRLRNKAILTVIYTDIGP